MTSVVPKKLISSGTSWEEAVGYSRAVRVGNMIFISGTTGTDENGQVMSPGDPYAQASRAIKNIEKALKAAGGNLSDVVQTQIYVTDIQAWSEIGKAHEEAFRNVYPSTAMIEVAKLIDPQMLVEISAIAVIQERKGGRE